MAVHGLERIQNRQWVLSKLDPPIPLCHLHTCRRVLTDGCTFFPYTRVSVVPPGSALKPSLRLALPLSVECIRQADLLVRCQCASDLNQFRALSFEGRAGVTDLCSWPSSGKHVAPVSLGLLLMMSIINMHSDRFR